MGAIFPVSYNETIRINRGLPIVPQVHFYLRQLIIYCILPPGSPIREKDFSLQLEVSRTPIREALLQLENENLVEIYPQSDTRISKLVWKKCLRVISFVKPWKVLQSDLPHSDGIPNFTIN